MLEGMMRLARTQRSGLVEYQIARTLGRGREEARLRQMLYMRELETKYPFFFWRPNRIQDERLRELATKLQRGNTEAGILMSDLFSSPAQQGAEWDEKANEVGNRIENVLEEIDQRLDELDW